MTLDIEKMLNYAFQQRQQEERASLDATEALARHFRQMVDSMLVVVDHAKKLTGVTQTPTDLIETGLIISATSALHQRLDEQRARLEQRAERLRTMVRR